MMLVITGVGSLILLYSTEYMEHDRDYRRFFAEMSFFVFSMLLLVEAGELPLPDRGLGASSASPRTC